MNMPLRDRPLESLIFDNSFVKVLPADPQPENYRRQVSEACYSRVLPSKVTAPKLVAYSRETAELLDLSEEACTSSLFTELFAGNSLLPGMDPFAMCYGGHQFGNWAGQLGDGRAINLGEIVNSQKERWVLQLKGAGPTPYSRQADGLAVLRSSIREFLCSEAMYHLGIPTTRALSVVTTGEKVLRDMFYDGHPKNEPGAVVCRVAPSFLRFGNYEILTARGDISLLKKLVDYTILTDFPHLGEPTAACYIEWFREICRTTAEMIIHWMRVGFVHGVMNTDNMSVLGLTIDYGPYGWLEGYEARWTPNTTDAHGRRYCFSNQPHIGQWNLLQLANAIYPLVSDAEPFKEALNHYNILFQKGWNDMLAGKLGLLDFSPATDDTLIGELVEILQLVETDMTIFFRNLATITPATKVDNESTLPEAICEAYYKPEEITGEYRQRMNGWLQSYTERLRQDNQPDVERQQKMNEINPKYVLRNYLAQLAIDKAESGDFSMVGELLDLLRTPYAEQPEKAHFAVKRPEWARNRAGCSMLSCSS
jgi:uncharacterized protein YdiU (UPF0061 family)